MYKEGGQYKVQLWMRDESGQEESPPEKAELEANAMEQDAGKGDDDDNGPPELEEPSDDEGEVKQRQHIGVITLGSEQLPDDWADAMTKELLAEDENDETWKHLKTGGSFVENENGDF